MGSFLEERIAPYTKLFTAICLDLLGPTIVKSMTNKRFGQSCSSARPLEPYTPKLPTTTAGTHSLSSSITYSFFENCPRRW